MPLPDTLHIRVTEDDLDKGYPKNPRACPISLAVNRTLAEHHSYAQVMTFSTYVRIRSYNEIVAVRYGPLPQRAQDFVHAYDLDRPVKPFEFDLPLGGRLT